MSPTVADARDTCAEGVTGLIGLYREEFSSYNRSLGEARHARGGYVKFGSAEHPDRWRGPQWSLLWIDEAALCDPESIEMADFGLRLGRHPRAVWTTTPKSARWLRAKLSSPGVVVTRATTRDNPHLAERVLDRLESRYGGTRLGRQELLAEMLDAPKGAIWPLLSERRERYLRPLPEDMTWTRSGAGLDWGITEVHQAAIHSGSVAKDGMIWIRRAWRSASRSSHAAIGRLREDKMAVGITWVAIDSSQWAIADQVEDSRLDADGTMIGAGLIALKGTRAVEWRVGLVGGLVERELIAFDIAGDGVAEAYEYVTQYHTDDDGRIVEAEDDDADALCYLVAELVRPGTSLPSGIASPAWPGPEPVVAGRFPEPTYRREPVGAGGLTPRLGEPPRSRNVPPWAGNGSAGGRVK